MRIFWSLLGTLIVVALLPAVPAAAAPVKAVAPSVASTDAAYNAVTPVRLLDTRTAGGGGPLGAGAFRDLTVTGSSPLAPTSATSVVVNVTVTNTTAASFLTVYPKGASQPTASNLNWVAGKTVPNLVSVQVGTGGAITMFNASGSTDVVVDLEGYFAPPGSSTAGGQVGMTPVRITDTRPASGFPNAGSTLAAGATITVQVTGPGLAPATAGAAILNVTVTDTTAASFLTVYPTGAAFPTASNLNWVAGQTVPNRVIIPIGTGGTVKVFNQFGSADVIVDLGGYFTDNTTSGAQFTSQSPVRIADTRISGGGPGPASTFTLPIGGVSAPSGATAVILNVTVTNTTAPSFLTAWPSTASRPTASDLNWLGGQTIPNLVVVALGTTGAVSFYNSAGSTDVVVDLAGFFGAGAAGAPAFMSASANQNSVKVIFNQPMNNAASGNGAANVLNYSVTSPSGSGAQTPATAAYSTVDNSVTFTLTTALTPGATFTVTVPALKQIDNAAGTGSIAAGASISGTVAVATPVITYPTAGETLNTHANGGGKPLYQGTYVNGTDALNISVDGTAIATTAGAAWTFTQPTALATGSHTLSVTATAGTSTSPAATVTFTISSVLPIAPVITSPIAGAANQSSLPTISGTGTAGATVDVTFAVFAATPASPVQATAGTDVVLATTAHAGTATVGSGGTWSFTPATPLLSSTHYNVLATQIQANYASGASNVPDFTTAVAPAHSATINTTTSSAGSNTASIVFTDAFEAGDPTVTVSSYNVYRANGVATAFSDASTAKVGSVSATGAASYTFTDTTAINGKSYTYFVTALTAAGAESTAPVGATPNTTIGPIVSAVAATPNPVASGANVVYSATVSQGATVDPANISTVVTHVLNSSLVQVGGTISLAGVVVNAAGYGTYASATQVAPAQGAYTDNTVATDTNTTAGNATAPFTVGAAPTVTTITVTASPTSVSNLQLSNIIATVKDQYGNAISATVTFSVAPTSGNGAGGSVSPASVADNSTTGQAATTYTAGSPAAVNSDTVTAAVGTVKGTASITVTPSTAPATGAPVMIAASTTSPNSLTVTFDRLVTLGAAATTTGFTLKGPGEVACHAATAFLVGGGSSSNSILLTFVTATNCTTFVPFAIGAAAGNLNATGVVANSTATTPVPNFTPQDIWLSSGF